MDQCFMMGLKSSSLVFEMLRWRELLSHHEVRSAEVKYRMSKGRRRVIIVCDIECTVQCITLRSLS